MREEFAIRIDTASGRGRITIQQDTFDVTAEDLAATRTRAAELAQQFARSQSRSVAGTAYEDGTPYGLLVTAEGEMLPVPPEQIVHEQAPAPEREAAPTGRRASHRATPGESAAPEPPGRDLASGPETVVVPGRARSVSASAPAAPASPPPPEAEPEEHDPQWDLERARPAAEGVRGALNGLGLRLSPTEEELARRRERYRAEAARRVQEERASAERQTRRAARERERAAIERAQRRAIQTNFQGTRTVLVANPKGGSRKTTSTYLLAATMGIIRGGSVIAWDANETMGTLGDRSQQDLHSRTVIDLLQEAAPSFTSVEGSRLGRLDAFVRPQGDSHFDVLASDEDATHQGIVDARSFGTVHEILSRFYRMIVVDSGNNIRMSHFLAAVAAADQLVIPVLASRDSARGAQAMMRSLRAAGSSELVKQSVVLVHDLEPRDVADGDYAQLVREVGAKFEGHVAAVIPVPYDPALKNGDEIEYEKLAPATQAAYQEAAAAITGSLRARLTSRRTHLQDALH